MVLPPGRPLPNASFCRMLSAGGEQSLAGAGGLQPSRQGYPSFHEQGKSRAEIGGLQPCVMAYSPFRERGKS